MIAGQYGHFFFAIVGFPLFFCPGLVYPLAFVADVVLELSFGAAFLADADAGGSVGRFDQPMVSAIIDALCHVRPPRQSQ